MAISTTNEQKLQEEYDRLRATGLSSADATTKIKSTLLGGQTSGGTSAFDTLKNQYNTPAGSELINGKTPQLGVSIGGVPEPTVATPKNPLVDKETIGVKPEADIVLNRENFINIVGKDPTKLTEKEKEVIRKVQARRAMGEELGAIFGETVTPTSTTSAPLPTPTVTGADITKTKEGLATATADLVTKKQTELDANLAKRKSELEALGEKQKQAAQSVLSSSGFGRSTVAATQMDSIQKNINDMVAAEQARSAQEIAIFKAQQEGADAKVIADMQKTLNDYNLKVQELEFNTAQEVAKQNATNKIKGQEALDNFLIALTTKTKEQLTAEGYDKDLSAKLGYAVDKFGKPLIVDGKKLEFTGEAGNSDAIESYASEIFKGNANISSVPDDKRDAVINRVAGMRNENKTSSSSLNEFKAEKILKTILKRTIDKQKDAAYLGFVSNMIDKGYSEDEIYSELGAADLKKTDFVSGNQKLFDDMQKDAQTYALVKGSFSNIKEVVDDAIKSGDTKSKASADQALIILFNKMLDPTSVVREGEYDRTATGQDVITQANGFLSRLMQGGASVTDDTRRDMVRIASILYKQAEKGMKIREQKYVDIAQDLGGDQDFVKRYFNGSIKTSENDMSEQDQIKSIFSPTGTGGSEYKSSSGKTFKLNFSTPEQSGSSTGLPNLTSERGKSIPYTGNVGKDLNNPGNLTVGGGADKYASGFITVTGKDGVTRKFLTFANKDAGYEAVKSDLQAKISGKSRYVKETDTLSKLLDVWVGGKGAGTGYKSKVQSASGYNLETPVKGLDVDRILKGIKIAEGA